MTENQSTELHLDLCPERTAHLLEALVIIKENFQMVDEILSAGLKNICSRISRENGDSTENIQSLQDGHLPTDEGEASENTTKQNDQEEKEKHRQCCCMCTLRVSTAKKQLISKSSASGALKTLSIDPRLSSKKRTGKPRLNRTASLRRESAVERRSSQVQATPLSPR